MPGIDVRQARNAHSRFLHELTRMIDSVAEEARTVAEKHVYFQSGFKNARPSRPGSIESSTRTRFVRTRSGNIVRVANTAKHAWAQEDGARPHIIVARRAKALRYVKDGRVFFRRWVRHPGNPATHFLLRATFAAGNSVDRELKARGEALARRF